MLRQTSILTLLLRQLLNQKLLTINDEKIRKTLK